MNLFLSITDGGFGASLLFRTGLDGNTLTINERRGVSDDSSDLVGLKLLPPKLPLLKLSSHWNHIQLYYFK